MPEDLQKSLHAEIRNNISKHVGSPFAFVNTRSWKILPNNKSFGPISTHRDGFWPGHLKIMIYLGKMNNEYGYFEIEGNKIIDKPEGTALFFQNSDHWHRGVSGNIKERISIEVTIMRTFINLDQYHPGHFLGRHYTSIFRPYLNKYNLFKIIRVTRLKVQKILHANFVNLLNKLIPISRLNIGSGERAWIGWDNVDELDFPTVKKVHFTLDTKLPKKNNKYNLIYSSHFFEHIDDKTINNLLDQINKNLFNNGVFILKVPAFEDIINSYRQNNLKIDSLNGTRHCETIVWSWKNFGVKDTIENRISCLIVGYWNNAYGHHYPRSSRNISPISYHGPARLPESELKDLLSNSEIKDIKNKLFSIAIKDPDFNAFNHCNAWSNSNLEKMLIDKGFKIESSNKEIIKKEYEKIIPDFNNMFSWSNIIKAKKL